MIEQNGLRMTYDNKAPCGACSYLRNMFRSYRSWNVITFVHVTLFMMRYSYRFGEYLSSERVVQKRDMQYIMCNM